MKLATIFTQAIKKFTNARGRKAVQNDHRSANSFDLKPMPAAAPFPQRVAPIFNPALTNEEYAQVQEELLDLTRPSLADLAYEPLPTAIDRLATKHSIQDAIEGDEREAIIIAEQYDPSVKPKGSNAWPWNKAMKCCGKREALCECGAARRYV